MKTLRSSMRRAGPSASALILGALLLLPAAGADAQQVSQSNGQSSSQSSGSSSSSSSRGQSSVSTSRSSSNSSPRATVTRTRTGTRTSTRVTTSPRTQGRQVQRDSSKENRRDTGRVSPQQWNGDSGRRPPSTTHHRPHYYPRGGHHYYYPYSPYYYPYYGYYGYYGPYGYLYFPHVYIGGGARYSYDTTSMGALDLDVSPEKAEIWVNGSPVGVADQYDGFPTYLWLEKGTYDIVIFKEGFQTISRQYTVYPGVVIDVNDRMVRGESVRPEDLASTSTAIRDERIRRDRERAERAEAEEAWRQDSGDAVQGNDPEGVGRLLLAVAPGDSAVYLDGHFLGTGAEISQLSAGLVVEPGQHVIELVRPGYQTEKVPVTVPPGERVTLDLEMQER